MFTETLFMKMCLMHKNLIWIDVELQLFLEECNPLFPITTCLALNTVFNIPQTERKGMIKKIKVLKGDFCG